MSHVLEQIAHLVLPTNPEEFWLCITGLGTVLLMLVAKQGLSSLGLAQKDMLTRATREARQSAITRAEEWAREIVTANAVILQSMAQNKIKVFVQAFGDVRFDPDNQTLLRAAGDWVSKLPSDTREQSLHVLNRMEAWSMYFTNQLADPKVAAGPCAAPFCSMVMQNYALLLLLRTSPTSGKFPNTVKLFKAWLAGLAQHEKEEMESHLLKALGQLQAKGPGADALPEPLGLDDR